MKKIYTEFDQNIPILKFTECANCSMPYGKHSKGLVNRGCCWYDVEFDLYDLKNLIDINIDILYNLLENYSYQIKNNDLYYAIEFPAIYHGKDDKNNKVCVFFERNKGCKLPIYARPFICRITLCPQVRLYVSPENYQKIRYFISKAYQHRLKSISEIKQKIDSDSINPENINEIIQTLKDIPPLNPMDKININILTI